jgi:hypothetical protein
VQIGGRVDAAAMVRHLQGMVHLCIIMKPIFYNSECGLCLIIDGAGRRNGNCPDCRGKFIVDPVRKLAQQQLRNRERSI